MPKSRRKSRAARGRKRDAKGHFVKASVAAPRRKRRRARASETAVATPRRRKRTLKNPWYKQPRRHAKAAKKGWRKRRSAARRRHAAPTRRVSRRRPRTIVASGRGRARRRGSKRSTPINIKVSLAPRKRRSSKRRASPKRHKSHARRRHAHAHYTPASHQLAADSYALANPLSGSELLLLGVSGLIGYGLADFAGRYMETTAVAAGGAANSVPTGATLPNDQATIGWPSWQAMATQFGLAALPMIGASFVDSPWGRAGLQGVGLGAGFALFGNIARNAMAQLIGSTALGQQLYLAEYEAQSAATAGAGTQPIGLSGRLRGMGRPAIPIGARGMGAAISSTAVAPRVSAPGTRSPAQPPAGVPSYNPNAPGGGSPPSSSIPMPPGILSNTGDLLPTPSAGTPTPGGPVAGPQCAPCSTTSGGIAGTYQTAVNAIRDESCLGQIPGPYATFPE